jgi:hypothetical protein
MMLAAADLGIGSGRSAVMDQEQAQRVLGFPDGYLAVYLIGLGYPADRPLRPLTPLTRPNRRPFDEVVHWMEPLVAHAYARAASPNVARCGRFCCEPARRTAPARGLHAVMQPTDDAARPSYPAAGIGGAPCCR